MRDRILKWLAQQVVRRPWTIVGAAASLAAACIVYAASTLSLNANTDDLVAKDRPFMVEYRQFLEEFGDLEYIVAAVENMGDARRAEAAVDLLAARMQQIPNLPAVYSGIDRDEQLRLATRAMPISELRDLAQAAGAFSALLSGETAVVLHTATNLLRQLIQSGASMSPDDQMRLGGAATFLMQVIASSHEGSHSAQELPLFAAHDQSKAYFKSETGRYYFVHVMSEKDYGTLSVVEEPLRKIREAIDEVRREFPELNIGLTGKPVLQADEMATSNADMTRASMLAVTLCAILFMIAFGNVWRPLLAVLAFACGAAWTYGFAAVTLGQLNLLSIVFMLVLIGVGMDYGIHIIARYREQRAEGNNVRDAIQAAVLVAGRGNFTGALTSSIVFFMAMFTSFQGLRELGLIAGAGLLLCVLAMTVVLPAILTLTEKGSANGKITAPPQGGFSSMSGLPTLFDRLNRRAGVLLILIAIATAALFAAPGRVRFEYNILELQATGLESVEWEHRILDDSAAASWFGAIVVDDQKRALEVIERAREKSTIGQIASVFDLVQPDTSERTMLRRQLHNHDDINLAPGEWRIDDLEGPIAALDLMARGAAVQAPDESAHLARLGDDLKSLMATLRANDVAAIALRERIDENVQQVARSLNLMLEGDQDTLREALPASVRDRYVSPAGRLLVMLHPRENVWEYDAMRAFIHDMRNVDPNVTGAPISHFESLSDMHRSFVQMAISALVVIAFILWLDFRNIKLTLLALIPTMLGMIWLVQAMGLLGISFNLANFFSVPILVGLSVDGAVHILHRYEEGGSARMNLGATRRAVIVTSLTTMIGFGCVMLAHHRGLNSLGQVMAMGSCFCLIATIIVLPAMLALLERWKKMRPLSA